MNSLAIKLDVSNENQQDLNNLLEKIGIKPQRRRFHCTVGFMDKVFGSSQEAEAFVKSLENTLNLEIPLPFTFKEPRFLFRHVIALVPDTDTLQALRNVNDQLHQKVNSLVNNRYLLNSQTTGNGYHPHITLWRQRHKDRRFKQVREELKEVNNLLQLSLEKYSYTVL